MLGLFPFVTMFVVTSITMLRERVTGTLERLMTMPLSKLELLAGYGVAFGVVAAVQATAVSLVAFGLLDLHVAGPRAVVVLLAVANAVLGSALGLFGSAFAQTEFQAVQFMPVVVLPQILLCGLFVARADLPSVLHAVSDVLPLSYAVDAMTTLTRTSATGDVWRDLAVVVAFVLGGLGLGSATLRRRTP